MKITKKAIRSLWVATLVAAIVGVASTSAAQGPPDGFALPEQAAEVAPGIFFLGTAVDHGVPVVGYAYAHHRGGHERGGGGDTEPTPDPTPEDSSCYSFIANGARWRAAEDVRVDSSSLVLGVSDDDIEGWMRAWEAQTDVSGIYGQFVPDTGLSADTTSTDGDNEVYFDTITDTGVLGYTIVWSTRIGPPSSRQIVEADIVVEDGQWTWWTGGPDTTPPGYLDLGAVFTHEAGHYVGLGHTDDTALCAAQTMYPSLSDGDGTKQSLGNGDIAGVEDLHA